MAKSSVDNYSRPPGFGAPVYYDYQNVWDSVICPATIKVANTGIAYYFKRYLLQRAIGVLEWTLPENWAENYFLYTLYTWGYAAVINTDKYGIIPQGCGLWGYNVQYQPTKCVISNPLLSGVKEPTIGKQCALIVLQPDYSGVMDIVNYFGNMLALSASVMQTNIFNSQLSYVFAAANHNSAKTFYAMFDKISAGEPAVAVDDKLYTDDGTPMWTPFVQNVGQNLIAPELAEIIRNTINDFDSYVGIPANNVQKKERMVVDEVNANNVENTVLCDLWLKSLKKGVDMANKLFPGLGLSVKKKYEQELIEDASTRSNDVYNRSNGL